MSLSWSLCRDTLTPELEVSGHGQGHGHSVKTCTLTALARTALHHKGGHSVKRETVSQTSSRQASLRQPHERGRPHKTQAAEGPIDRGTATSHGQSSSQTMARRELPRTLARPELPRTLARPDLSVTLSHGWNGPQPWPPSRAGATSAGGLGTIQHPRTRAKPPGSWHRALLARAATGTAAACIPGRALAQKTGAACDPGSAQERGQPLERPPRAQTAIASCGTEHEALPVWARLPRRCGNLQRSSSRCCNCYNLSGLTRGGDRHVLLGRGRCRCRRRPRRPAPLSPRRWRRRRQRPPPPRRYRRALRRRRPPPPPTPLPPPLPRPSRRAPAELTAP